MAKVCFHFEPNIVDVYSGRLEDLDAWRYAMRIPGDITEVIVVDSSNVLLGEFDGNFEWTITDTIPTLDGNVTFMVTPNERDDSITLWDFDHNTDWYVFGPTYGWHGKYQGVTIPQSNPLISLHPVHMISTVMFHRYHVLGG